VVAIDVGGTFTDIALADLDTGQLWTTKTPTTPHDQSQGFATGVAKILQQADKTPGDVVATLHGSTVATNMIIERKGSPLALLTTAGCRYVLHIGRHDVPKSAHMYLWVKPPRLVTPEHIYEIPERLAHTGAVQEPLDEAACIALLRRLQEQRFPVIAISLLHAYANPMHEQRLKALCKQYLPDTSLSVSSEVLPQFREYERTSTVVVNAYLQPVIERYLESLDRRLKGPAPLPSRKSNIFVMQSSGGITALSTAVREPARTVLSGPAGGVVGAAATARRGGFGQIISFDMGGTSTDVALVDREARASSQSEVAGFPIGVPMIDIHTVGAGGGSLARFDAAGALRVGPESAGADPGPICYGKATLPTVTDANLLLGHLQPHRFLGGNFQLDLDRTRQVVREWLRAQKSNLSLEQFAAGVIRVVNATMEKAIRVVSIERGRDPRLLALVAFGGAGGLHACDLAQSLGIPRVMVPAMPGAVSAFGILVSDVVKDYSRTLLWRVTAKLPFARLEDEFARLSRAAKRDFRSEGWTGTMREQRSVDLRYRGQGYDLNVPFSPSLIAAFHEAHAQRYGYSHPEREIEIVTARMRAVVKSPQARVTAGDRARLSRQGSAVSAAELRPVLFNGRKLRTPIYDRGQLISGKKYTGPAVITEYSATTVVPPAMRFWPDPAGPLMIANR